MLVPIPCEAGQQLIRSIFLVIVTLLRPLSHTSQGPWPCGCEGPQLSSKRPYHLFNYHDMLEFAYGLPLKGAHNENSNNHNTTFLVNHVRIHADFFIHDNFFGLVGLCLLVCIELGQSWPSQPMRDLRMQWSWAFNLVCKVTLVYPDFGFCMEVVAITLWNWTHAGCSK